MAVQVGTGAAGVRNADAEGRSAGACPGDQVTGAGRGAGGGLRARALDDKLDRRTAHGGYAGDTCKYLRRYRRYLPEVNISGCGPGRWTTSSVPSSMTARATEDAQPCCAVFAISGPLQAQPDGPPVPNQCDPAKYVAEGLPIRQAGVDCGVLAARFSAARPAARCGSESLQVQPDGRPVPNQRDPTKYGPAARCGSESQGCAWTHGSWEPGATLRALPVASRRVRGGRRPAP